MKVFIPINSNNFNSIFSTLSVSPVGFYGKRKYSFKRATISAFNEDENSLIAFDRPVLHNFEFDNDYGYPILLEINLNDITFIETKLGFSYTLIKNTVYLNNDFRLIFRTKKELDETYAKSLKSIETKYTLLAKNNSEVFKSDFFLSSIPKLNSLSQNEMLTEQNFKRERILNRFWGVVLGSSLASTDSYPSEWRVVLNQVRKLKNRIALFVNDLSSKSSVTKKEILKDILSLAKSYGQIETLDEVFVLDSTISPKLLAELKEINLYGLSLFDIIKQGLISGKGKKNLPIPLLIDSLYNAVDSKYNSKFPNKYIEKINDSFRELTKKIESYFHNKKNKIVISDSSIIFPVIHNPNSYDLAIPSGLKEYESKYLSETLKFFISFDSIFSVDQFFSNREEICIALGKHFKENISSFPQSEERLYLFDLIKSFSNLRGRFDLSKTNNSVLKVLAILFTTGRDFLKFLESNEKENIQETVIYHSIWGAIYGASVFPKTVTESITQNKNNLKLLVDSYERVLKDFQNFKFRTISSVTPNFVKDERIVPQDTVQEPVKEYVPELSDIALSIYSLIQEKRKIKLSDIVKVNKKAFKRNNYIKQIIENELNEKIKIIKEGRTEYAILDNENELFK